MPGLPFGIPQEFCNAVTRVGAYQSQMGALACHPYNQDDPELSIWWLFPRVRSGHKNWPAYEYGKFFFDKPRGRRELRTGLYVERGMSREAAQLATGANRHLFELTDTWIWHAFVADMSQGELGSVLDEIAGGIAPDAVEIEIACGPSPFESGDWVTGRTTCCFNYSSGDGSLELIESNPSEMLTDLEHVTDVSSLGELLKGSIAVEPMLWIDVLVAVPFQAGAADDGPPGSLWTADQVWQRVLRPLASWIRRGP